MLLDERHKIATWMSTVPALGLRLALNLDQLVSVHQLRLLTAVIEQAASPARPDALGSSQPAISHQLKALSRPSAPRSSRSSAAG